MPSLETRVAALEAKLGGEVRFFMIHWQMDEDGKSKVALLGSKRIAQEPGETDESFEARVTEAANSSDHVYIWIDYV